MSKCPTCGVINPGDFCAYCNQMIAKQPSPDAASSASGWPHWLTAGRVWIILKLGSLGLLLASLAGIFAFTLDVQIAVYPFLGCLVCFSALGVFFWRWTHAAVTAPGTEEVAGIKSSE